MRRMIPQKQIEKLNAISNQFTEPLPMNLPLVPITQDEYNNCYNKDEGMYSGTICYGDLNNDNYIAIYIECDAAGDSPEEVMENWEKEGLIVEGDCYEDESVFVDYEGYSPDSSEIARILSEGELSTTFSFYLYPQYSFTPKTIQTENIQTKTASVADNLYAKKFRAQTADVDSLLQINSGWGGRGQIIGSVDTRFKVLVNDVEQDSIPGRTTIRRVDNKFIITSVHIPGSVLKIWFEAQNANGTPLTLFFHSNDDTHINASMTYTTTEMKHTGIITIDCTNYSSYYANFMIEILSETTVKFINHPQA